ncbi:MAG: RNA polymerase sigma factor [Bacteroidota bacterium]|jgi:RNA polymerase sigma-70 factor (ECF subfamily)
MELSKKARFMQLYEPVHERFERYCKTRAFGEFHYKDIMHDTLVVAFEKFEEIKSKEGFLYFLFGTAAKILSNQRRKKKPEYIENYSSLDENSIDHSESAEQRLEIKNLYIQLDKLDDVTRECLILFEISGFSIKEIMTIQDLSESAVKQRLFRGRKQLIELMNEQKMVSK